MPNVNDNIGNPRSWEPTAESQGLSTRVGPRLLQTQEEGPKNHPRKRLIEKMFNAALKEKFVELTQKYDPSQIFVIWTQMAKTGGDELPVVKWSPNTTIGQALDSLDDYCKVIESLIQKRA